MRLLSLPTAALAGAAAAYFLDPEHGDRRRKMAGERAQQLARSAGERGGQVAQSATAQAQRAAHPQSSQEPPGDDITLARKVETEIFRPADAPKGQVNVSAENGIVSLRGQLDDEGQIEELVSRAGAIPGVKAVENLLHTPHTEAPTRAT